MICTETTYLELVKDFLGLSNPTRYIFRYFLA